MTHQSSTYLYIDTRMALSILEEATGVSNLAVVGMESASEYIGSDMSLNLTIVDLELSQYTLVRSRRRRCGLFACIY